MMRKAYANAAFDWGVVNFMAPMDLTMGLAQMCQAIADAELAEQGKQHAKIYEHEIALLKAEIIALNEDIAFYTEKLQPDEREYV